MVRLMLFFVRREHGRQAQRLYRYSVFFQQVNKNRPDRAATSKIQGWERLKHHGIKPEEQRFLAPECLNLKYPACFLRP